MLSNKLYKNRFDCNLWESNIYTGFEPCIRLTYFESALWDSRKLSFPTLRLKNFLEKEGYKFFEYFDPYPYLIIYKVP